MKSTRWSCAGLLSALLLFGAVAAIASDFVYIPPGTFMMGSPATEPLRSLKETQHQVTLTRGFYVQTTEVTNQQYRDMAQWAYDNGHVTATTSGLYDKLDGSTQLLKDLGSGWYEITFSAGVFSCINPTHPVKLVNWYGSAAYCDWLSLQQGLTRAYNHSTWQCNEGNPYTATGYRLPNEAEWEYACRAGAQTPFNTGSCLDAGTEANYAGSSPYTGCPAGPYVGWTVPVGSYPANAFGLYDMHGNLFEWCHDGLGTYGGTVTDPVGVSEGAGSGRVIRGGCWNRDARRCRSAERFFTVDPSDSYTDLGFRPVRSADENTTCTLTANVHDMATAAPLVGATVVLQQQDAVTTRSLTTNQLGQCTFEGLSMGSTVVLRAIVGTFRSDLKIVVVGPEKTPPVLRVPQSYEVRGLVRDALNQLPISGAKVELMSGATSITEYITTGMLLDGAPGDYNFRLSPPGPGEYRLRVSYKRRIGVIYTAEQDLYKQVLSEPFSVTTGVRLFNRGNIDMQTNVVLLLHGTQSSAEIWGNGEWGFVSALHAAGWAPLDGINLGYSRRHRSGVDRYGFDTIKNMNDTLVAEWKKLGVQSCNIIAHSAGGLVARYFNEYRIDQPKPLVKTLVTLGTPHHGTRIVEWGDVKKINYAECDNKTLQECAPLTNDVTPDSEFLRNLNQRGACPNLHDVVEWCDWFGTCTYGVPAAETTLREKTTYWAAQGTDSQSPWWWPWSWWPGGGWILELQRCSDNDGVVPVISAKLYAEGSHNTSFDVGHSELVESDAVRQWAVERLSGLPLLFDSHAAPPARTLGVKSGLQWSEIMNADVTLVPGVVWRDSLFVDACDSMVVGYSWLPPAAEFVVTTPGGARIDSTYAAASDSVEFGNLAEASSKWYSVAGVEPGFWKTELLVPAIEDSIVVRKWAYSTSTVRMESRLASAGDPVTGARVLVCSLTDPVDGVVTGAVANARIVQPDASVDTLTLRDDGSYPDDFADDGSYSGIVPDNGVAGGVTIEVVASGSLPRNFVRTQQINFRALEYANVSIGGEGVTVEGSSFLAGSQIVARAQIVNAGPRSGLVAVTVTDESIGAVVDEDTLSIAVGGSVNHEVRYTPMSEGAHRLRFRIWPVGEAVDPIVAGNSDEVDFVIGDMVAGIPTSEGDWKDPEPTDAGGRRWMAIRGVSPNPFNPVIDIAFWVGKSAKVSLDIFDLRGRLVCPLIRDDNFSGDGSVRWNGRDSRGMKLASGVYFARLQAGDATDVRKILLLE